MTSRRLPRAAAPLVLFAWLLGLMLPVLGAGHARGLDDPACERPIWTTGHPVTQLESDLRSTDDGHCGICHLQRAVRGALHSVARTVQYTQAVTVAKVVRQCHLRSTVPDVASSRAPPPSLVSVVS